MCVCAPIYVCVGHSNSFLMIVYANGVLNRFLDDKCLLSTCI